MPLSADDSNTLEAMVAQIQASSGARPSVGQLVSVHVIPRPHANIDLALPLGRTDDARREMGGSQSAAGGKK